MSQWVVLWTDALLGLLAGAAAGAAAWSLGREPLRRAWRQSLRRPLAMASLVVLAAYGLVAALDSVHFRPAQPAGGGTGKPVYGPEVWSLLDVALRPLKENVEKSYSAPFATHAYDRETVRRPDGTVARERLRLQFGGAHLADPERERGADILRASAIGLGWGLAAWAALAAGVTALLAASTRAPFGAVLGRVARGRTGLPWRAMLLTAGALVLAAVWAAAVAPRYHVLGTDKVGQDVLYLAVKGVRTSLVLGTVTSLVMLPFAVPMGILAGYCGGWVDDAIQYVYTTLSSIPGVLLIAASILTVQSLMEGRPELFPTAEEKADVRLLSLCVILGVTGWIGLCRLLRGEALKLRELDYVQSAAALGAGPARVLARHLLPNVFHIILIVVVLEFSALVLAEAVLSYIGIGVSPTMSSWGNMINGARLEMARDPIVWWSLAAAFGFMLALVLAANLFADAVRDAFDPRVKI